MSPSTLGHTNEKSKINYKDTGTTHLKINLPLNFSLHPLYVNLFSINANFSTARI